MLTHTPITHWIAMPLRQLYEWAVRVRRIQIDDATKAPEAGG